MAARVLTEEDLEPLRRELAELRALLEDKRSSTTGERNQGKGTYVWTKRKETVLMRAAWKCEVCGYSGPLNIHHKVPRRDGGSDELDNLIALCPNHHAEAHHQLAKARRAVKGD